MRDAPTIRQELIRKTNEAVVAAIERLKNGAITVREYRATLWALWDMSSGLTDEETRDLIESAMKIAEKEGWERRVLVDPRDGELAIFEWTPWPDCKARVRRVAVSRHGRVITDASDRWFEGNWRARRKWLAAIMQRYQDKGWKRVI